ncbi:hypothetical protein K431DRAFT_305544 [Polychaeton citri CBS 116435]|uniref:Uncharacterized protein n=1 Tax=Polychaeton citri CBS 116435 TaxID=1314669 RepID=A0A9P4ULW3_9PEZI|nr:hypothetical protein K431DRAFT_305544 [Polychaeton citri CBS 116435]
MQSIVAASTLMGLWATQVLAQDQLGLCTGAGCEYCPNKLTTAGKGYPTCVVYDRDTTLGGFQDQYKLVADTREVWFDIPLDPNPQCKTIVRSPAGNDQENCGYPVVANRGGVCFKAEIKPSFMIQFCCGTGDCTAAGVEKRDDNSLVFSSVVLRDAEGDLVVPHSVGQDGIDRMPVFLEDYGVDNATITPSKTPSGALVYKIDLPQRTAKAKRDCDHYEPDGDPYTKTGLTSQQVGGYICGKNTRVDITNENSVSRSTTFGSSVSDPFGIVSASIEFTTEEEASQSYTYSFTPEKAMCGHVAFTPFFTCTGGTITGCDGGDQKGEVCTAKRIDKSQIDGAYHFVQTG